MTNIQTCKFLAAVGVGPREGIALFAVIKMKGRAQVRHVREELGAFTSDVSAIIRVLRQKELIKSVKNPSGHSFWRLTAVGLEKIAKAKEEATR